MPAESDLPIKFYRQVAPHSLFQGTKNMIAYYCYFVKYAGQRELNVARRDAHSLEPSGSSSSATARAPGGADGPCKARMWRAPVSPTPFPVAQERDPSPGLNPVARARTKNGTGYFSSSTRYHFFVLARATGFKPVVFPVTGGRVNQATPRPQCMSRSHGDSIFSLRINQLAPWSYSPE